MRNKTTIQSEVSERHKHVDKYSKTFNDVHHVHAVWTLVFAKMFQSNTSV